ncbi:hypothetical protein [Actinacidiphila glaucinigra]|uniref:hypothetical protein n=1 Tax=Actinacidiphila glaucinigra TaxID=235986 RepID=UPI0035DD25DF
MKLGYVTAAALLAALPFTVTSPPAAALETTHIVKLTATMRTYACCDFLTEKSHEENTTLHSTLNLTNSKRHAEKKFELCAGEEARGVLRIHADLLTSGEVQLSPWLTLYEGTSCLSTDDEGRSDFAARNLKSGRGSMTWEMTVHNTEFHSDDEAFAKLTVTHDIWP